MKRTFARVGAASVAIALALAFSGCSRGAAKPSPGASAPASGPGLSEIAVRTAPVALGSLAVDHKASGTVKPVMQSQVASQAGGIVARVLFKAGDWIDAGRAVIQLDDSQLQLSVKTAEASLEAAKINLSTSQDSTQQDSPRLDFQLRSAESALAAAQKNYDAKKGLFDMGGATSADIDQANQGLQAAQANLEAAKTALDQNKKADVQNIAQLRLSVEQADYALQQARLNLKHASIEAPYAGRLVAVNVMPGEYVSPNTPAFVIASQEREVDFSVPPLDSSGLPVGAPVDFELNGVVHRLRLSQNPNAPVNGVVPLVATGPATPTLPFGAIGTISYSLVLARGSIVPTGAIQTSEDRNFVFVIEGGKAARRTIAILAESGDAAAVKGLDSGGAVIVNPPPGLMDGSVVKAVAAPDGSK